MWGASEWGEAEDKPSAPPPPLTNVPCANLRASVHEERERVPQHFLGLTTAGTAPTESRSNRFVASMSLRGSVGEQPHGMQAVKQSLYTNVGICGTKLCVWLMTGSAAMYSDLMHRCGACGLAAVLCWGRAKREAQRARRGPRLGNIASAAAFAVGEQCTAGRCAGLRRSVWQCTADGSGSSAGRRIAVPDVVLQPSAMQRTAPHRSASHRSALRCIA